MVYLDHNHGEGEYVCLPAGWTVKQDFRRSPSRSVATPMLGALYRIQTLIDHSKGKITDARTASVVHKNVWLTGSQDGGETRFSTTTHTLEVPMNYIARV